MLVALQVPNPTPYPEARWLRLLVAALCAPSALSSSRVVGMQPRGNAVVRDARQRSVSGNSRPVATAQQTARLRTEAMDYLGLNVNDYWTLKSGKIRDVIPSATPEAERQLRQE